MGEKDNLEQLVEQVTLKVKQDFESLLKENPKPSSPKPLKPQDIAGYIDHTLLRADATFSELKKLCAEARENGFKTVCVNSANLPLVADELKNSSVLPIAVVGFPLGAMLTKAKVFETKECVKHGAKEIDMVINIGKLKSKDYCFVLDDIRSVVEAAKPNPVKVIIETALLNTEEKIIASYLSREAEAAFVKTSTGFASGGAREDDLRLIRLTVGKKTMIKASGGIKTYEDAVKMIRAGADRIGSSAGVSIINEARKK